MFLKAKMTRSGTIELLSFFKIFFIVLLFVRKYVNSDGLMLELEGKLSKKNIPLKGSSQVH